MPRDLVAYAEPAEVDADGEVLLRAAELIEQHGWLQKCMGRLGGPHCMLGAMYEAAGLDPNRPAHSLPMGVFGRAWDTVGGSIVDFNNAPGRTKAEVIARLRDAAYRRL